jgi:ABC-type Fe3+ transport system permease subunit
MEHPRRFARLGRAAYRLLAAALASALVATAVLDTDPESKPRASLFPPALAILDPALRDCLRRSGIVATVVAVGSVLLGVPLARAIARRRFWLRRPLAALACAPLAVPPLVTALGLRHLLGAENLTAAPPLSLRGALATGEGPGGAWLALIWTGLVRGVPLVAIVTAHALGRIDPLWEAAGRSAGATPRALRRDLARPLIRGAVWRAAAVVFGLTLFDPGAPLILDLRRTLGYQLALGATGGEPARTAVLAILGALLALAAVGLARWAGAEIRTDPPRSRPPRASWLLASWLVAMLATWLAFAWLPVAGLLGGLVPGPPDSTLDPGSLVAFPAARRAMLDSLVLGVLVATLGLLVAVLVPAGRRPVATPWGSIAGILLVPSATALALLPVPLRAAAEWASLPGFARAASRLDPVSMPGLALTLALIAAWRPALAEALAAARGRWRTEFADAAAALGASRRRAWLDLAWPMLAPPVVRAWAMVAGCAACDASAALLLAPTDRFRPIGPTILALWDDPAAGRTVVALATVAAITCGLASSVGLTAADRQEGPSRAQ